MRYGFKCPMCVCPLHKARFSCYLMDDDVLIVVRSASLIERLIFNCIVFV